MKKLNLIIATALVALFSLALSSCGGGAGGKSPADIEMSVWKEMQKGNYEKALNMRIEHTYFEDEKTKDQLKSMTSALVEKAKESNDEKNGIKNVELAEENINEEEGTASVTVKVTYGDDSTDDESTNYVLRDGKWMIDGAK